MSSPKNSRDFALEVVQRLRDRGYESLWAGGCVRDLLLHKQPSDYDVATNATPDQVCEVFGNRKTAAVGAAFGVIVVRGPRGVEPVEVATFRRDAEYRDGRRPNAVVFSDAKEDAQRRDFTMNGIFFDPLTERTIDFVDGEADLAQGIVRAIGNPADRIYEDKLRMLRAVRFTAAFGFELDAATFAAVCDNAPSLCVVSAERIASELRRMLTHASRRCAAELLSETGLLPQVFPELADHVHFDSPSAWWKRTLSALDALVEPPFPVALALLLHYPQRTSESIVRMCRRLKLSNDETDSADWLIEHAATVRTADQQPWPKLQRLLIQKRSCHLLQFARALAQSEQATTAGIEFCQRRLDWPAEQLNPPPLLDGNDLIAAGVQPGKAFRRILEGVRDGQLNRQIESKSQAIEFAKQMLTSDADHTDDTHR